jgi:hypothetical protein
VNIDGYVVEEDLLGVIGEIQSRWPELKVQYLDPSHFAEPGEAPWRVVEACKDGVDRLVCQVWELDKRVIDRIAAADMYDPSYLKNLETQNILAKMDSERRFREEMDLADDITKHVIKSNKGRYSFPAADGGVVLADDTAPSRRIK